MLMKCINKVLKLSRPSLAHGSKLENFQRKTSTIILRADQCSGGDSRDGLSHRYFNCSSDSSVEEVHRQT